MNRKAMQSLIFAGGLTIGALGAGIYFHKQNQDTDLLMPKRDLTTLYDNMFDREFFRQSHHPFEQMEKMRRDMDKFFQSSMNDFSRFTFEDWYGSKFGGSIGDVRQEEDAKYVYYKINLKGIDKNTIKTDVSGGQVTISGSNSNIQAEEEKGASIRSEGHQFFKRSLPVPGGVDPNKVQFETTDDELVIKFPKMPVTDEPMV